MSAPADPAASERELEDLLGYLRDARGFDFTGYKRTSLARRIRKRMADIGTTAYDDYRDVLEADPEEFNELFNTILINVTGFFRDSESWAYLAAEALPQILADKAPDEEIRIWSAGCSSGEEAYTLAILFAEAIGLEQCARRLKIYGTDVDGGGAAGGPQRRLPAPGARGARAGPARAVLRGERGKPRVPRRPAPAGDLRAPRHHQGRADLAPRSAGVPEANSRSADGRT